MSHKNDVEYKIKFNSRNKKFMVFKVQGTGFGSWKIMKGFETESQANAFIASLE
jgi:hypothetical protein